MEYLNRFLAKTKWLNWAQKDEENRKNKEAIKYLLKNLVKSNEKCAKPFEELDKALSFQNQQSKCITIMSNMDGRIQVSGMYLLVHKRNGVGI